MTSAEQRSGRAKSNDRPGSLACTTLPRSLRAAVSYDLWGRLTDSVAHGEALKLTGIASGERILEIGAGTGLLFRRIVEANPSGLNVGLDISPGMLAKASAKLRACPAPPHLHVASAKRLPCRDGSFDLIMAAYVLDILDEADFVPVLRECSRVVKPGGRLVLVNWSFPRRWFGRVWSLLARIHPKLMGGCRPIDITPFLPKAGWQLVAQQHVSQNSFPSEVVLALKASEAR